MKDKVRHFGFVERIQNRQFQKLFFKNWLQVFLCIVLPLVLCISIVWSFSKQSLLREMDTAADRSTGNTLATLNTLLEEVYNSLENQMLNERVQTFLRMERTEPQKYEYIAAVNGVQDVLDKDYRENLHYSLDVYTEVGDYVISVLHKAQSYSRFSDKNLVETFYSLLEENPSQNTFADVRSVYQGEMEADRRIFTFYWARFVGGGKKAFASISVDVEKVIEYITNNHDRIQGAYLILDKNNQVLLDTAHQMNDQYVDLPEDPDISAITSLINGQQMRISWMSMDRFGWKCVQMVPMEEYERSSNQQQKLVMIILLLGVVAAVVLSYGTTCRLFRPVEAILRLLENPSEQVRVGDEDGEIQYMLVSILELFQKNVTLEQEMLDRVVALRRARAKALQEQMTPHFLNNVLQAINWTAITETGSENSVTSQSLILLADILCTAKAQKTNITTVEEEIVYTRKFVELECLRYGPNIHCSYMIDPAVQQMPIPCISLQTLVENSISHGLQPRKASGNIYISIHALEQSGLHICVEDDGVGIAQVKIREIFDMLQKEYIYVGEHLGIINLFQRFRLIYGEKCEFDIRRSEYGGACVEIKTPRLPEWWIQGSDK